MVDKKMKCVKCGGEMEEGKHSGALFRKGKENIFHNIAKAMTPGTIKVESYRCTSCGYLESYAQ